MTRDLLDLQLIKLWEKVLNVRPVGLRENFFDLGGNSLGAVRLFSEMRKMFGRSFPLSVLFQAPTVEKLADMIRQGGWRPQWTSLVPIQTDGTKPTFFCVHGGGGNVLIYRDLSRHLGKDYPFYGLQARGVDGSKDYLTTTEAMAESYLREVRELQPEGPYYIGGFCMGGQVAVEMAQRLVRDGQEVKLLFVIDTHNFNGVPVQLTLSEKVGQIGQKIQISLLERPMQLGVQGQIRLPFGKIRRSCSSQRDGTIAHQDRPFLQIEYAQGRLGAHRGIYRGHQRSRIPGLQTQRVSGQDDHLQAAQKLFFPARSAEWLGRNCRRRAGSHRIAIRSGRHIPRTLRCRLLAQRLKEQIDPSGDCEGHGTFQSNGRSIEVRDEDRKRAGSGK